MTFLSPWSRLPHFGCFISFVLVVSSLASKMSLEVCGKIVGWIHFFGSFFMLVPAAFAFIIFGETFLIFLCLKSFKHMRCRFPFRERTRRFCLLGFRSGFGDSFRNDGLRQLVNDWWGNQCKLCCSFLLRDLMSHFSAEKVKRFELHVGVQLLHNPDRSCFSTIRFWSTISPLRPLHHNFLHYLCLFDSRTEKSFRWSPRNSLAQPRTKLATVNRFTASFIARLWFFEINFCSLRITPATSSMLNVNKKIVTSKRETRKDWIDFSLPENKTSKPTVRRTKSSIDNKMSQCNSSLSSQIKSQNLWLSICFRFRYLKQTETIVHCWAHFIDILGFQLSGSFPWVEFWQFSIRSRLILVKEFGLPYLSDQ